MIPRHAYLFGFLQADGSLEEATRNRGKVRVEVAERDGDILRGVCVAHLGSLHHQHPHTQHELQDRLPDRDMDRV